MLAVLALLAALALACWLGLALHPARPWDARPVSEDDDDPPPSAWPAVVAVVPARNESESLPRALPALLGQQYAGAFHVVLVDDRSDDGTAEVARRVAREAGREERLSVVAGAPLPDGWAGKPHAMEQGRVAARARAPRFVLFTDADILHAPGSVSRHVSAALARGSVLESRMAKLSCRHPIERLLVPPFVWFFNLLYPMRRVNDPGDPLAAAAGGSMLADAAALEAAGGLACIRDRLIDDVSLAKALKARGGSTRLALSRGGVTSLREYAGLGPLWRMVRRNAFTELRHSWLRLAISLLGLALLFGVPPVAAGVGLAGVATGSGGAAHAAFLLGAGAWALSARLFLPAVRHFGLPSAWAATLPLAGLLYGAMTLDSARLHLAGRPEGWRPPTSGGPSG